MNLAWNRINLTLRHPFVTAAAIRTHKQTIWVRLSHDGIEGWGEAVPTDLYHQTLDSAEKALKAIAKRLPPNPADFDDWIDRLLRDFDDQRATVAAIDAAVHDWRGKAAGRPVGQMLGLELSDIPPTSVTLGIDEPARLVEKMREIAAFPIWKVKIGTELEDQTLRIIRAHAPGQTLRVDANMGWTAADALPRLKRAAAYAVELVEQPCPPDDLATLARLKSVALAPIVADESCVRPADIPRVAAAVDGINIKLSKCGGIREAHRMLRDARVHGLRVMLGCMIESSLGIAAAAQLAPIADWLDLDGHLLLRNDPFSGIGGARGRLRLGASPGLGVQLSSNK
jgi:L-alanine-DL-glutamate epimerase-like enolase superfamily enzyme